MAPFHHGVPAARQDDPRAWVCPALMVGLAMLWLTLFMHLGSASRGGSMSTPFTQVILRL